MERFDGRSAGLKNEGQTRENPSLPDSLLRCGLVLLLVSLRRAFQGLQACFHRLQPLVKPLDVDVGHFELVQDAGRLRRQVDRLPLRRRPYSPEVAVLPHERGVLFDRRHFELVRIEGGVARAGVTFDLVWVSVRLS